MPAEDAVGLLIPITFFVMLAVEALRPARTFPKIRAWRFVGFGFFVALMAINIALPLALPTAWMAEHRLIDGTRLGIAGGAAVGYLAVSLAAFLWHRAEHGVPILWRTFHQLHHSPTRLDIPGSVYFHPLDVAAQTALSLAVTVLVLGLDPVAAAITGFVGAFYGIFQHWNIRTPRWLGYLIQRPESHCLHHEKNVHARNYSDLPLWDMIFGSFHNPDRFAGEVGFEPDAARRVGAMLAFVDVHAGGSPLLTGSKS